MGEKIIITGVTISQQMAKAKAILDNQVIPKEKTFQKKLKKGTLSQHLVNALKVNG